MMWFFLIRILWCGNRLFRVGLRMLLFFRRILVMVKFNVVVGIVVYV